MHRDPHAEQPDPFLEQHDLDAHSHTIIHRHLKDNPNLHPDSHANDHLPDAKCPDIHTEHHPDWLADVQLHRTQVLELITNTYPHMDPFVKCPNPNMDVKPVFG